MLKQLNRNGRSWLPARGDLLLVLLVTLLMAWAGKTGALAPLAPQAPAAASTSIIPYQGVLSDDAGLLLNGAFDLTFRLYSVPAGGVALWSESANDVQITNGLFSAQLGSTTPITNGILENGTLWLGLSVQGGAELLPRTQLGAMPYAVSALKKMTPEQKRVKQGRFTRYIDPAPTDQAITGVGFRPRMLIVIYAIGGTKVNGHGFARSPTSESSVYLSNSIDGFYTMHSSAMIHLVTGNASATGALKSFDADGFTVEWSEVGAPSGTVSVSYLAIE